jgi:RimJ/RimL family protein N-acetyltransferase
LGANRGVLALRSPFTRVEIAYRKGPMTEPRGTPRTIALETRDYIIRTLEKGDASETWRDWLADPETARMLNTKPVEMDVETVRNYIASFDRVRAHLLGIFEKANGRLVGIRAVYVDHKRREFLVNVLVGDKAARNKGARAQSRAAVYRHFFEAFDLEIARATVVAENKAVLDGMSKRGWIDSGPELKAKAMGSGNVEIHKFHLPRDVWRRLAAAWNTE